MIQISRSIVDQLVAHAKRCYPQEACGLLAGKAGRIEKFLPICNMENSSVSYAMDPKEQMKAFRSMDEERLELCGIFHTHVASSAEPSKKDRVMATYPEVSYFIMSLADLDRPDLKAFRMINETDAPEELRVVVEDSAGGKKSS